MALFLPLAWSYSPDVDTICHTTLEIDSTNSCWKKLIWIKLNQIKPLGFDFWSNTSSWRFFKSSISYPCFWTQNSLSTCQQVICSIRILMTLHLVRVDPVLLCNDAMLPKLGRRLSDHAITDNGTSIILYQRIKSTHTDDRVQQNN